MDATLFHVGPYVTTSVRLSPLCTRNLAERILPSPTCNDTRPSRRRSFKKPSRRRQPRGPQHHPRAQHERHRTRLTTLGPDLPPGNSHKHNQRRRRRPSTSSTRHDLASSFPSRMLRVLSTPPSATGLLFVGIAETHVVSLSRALLPLPFAPARHLPFLSCPLPDLFRRFHAGKALYPR